MITLNSPTCPDCGADLCQFGQVLITMASGMFFDTLPTRLSDNLTVVFPHDGFGDVVMVECNSCHHDLEKIEESV